MRNGPVNTLLTTKCPFLSVMSGSVCDPNDSNGHHNSRTQYFASGTGLPDVSFTTPAIDDCSRIMMTRLLTGPPPCGVAASTYPLRVMPSCVTMAVRRKP